jgi:hypothetical protein
MGHHGNDRVKSTGRTGILGFGQSFSMEDGIVTDALDPKLFSPPAFTLSAWVRCAGTGGIGGDIISVGDSYGLRIGSDGSLYAWIWPQTAEPGAQYPWISHSIKANLKDGRWHYVAATWQNGQLQLYLDGKALGLPLTAPGPLNANLGVSMVIGRHGHGKKDYHFLGDIDEVQVSHEARSAEWLRATYENQVLGTAYPGAAL